MLQHLIRQNAALQTQSAALQTQSATIRAQSAGLQTQSATIRAQSAALQTQIATIRAQRSRDSGNSYVEWEIPKLTATKKNQLGNWLEYKFKLKIFCIQVGLSEVFKAPANASPQQWETLSGYLSQGCTGITATELQKYLGFFFGGPLDSTRTWIVLP